MRELPTHDSGEDAARRRRVPHRLRPWGPLLAHQGDRMQPWFDQVVDARLSNCHLHSSHGRGRILVLCFLVRSHGLNESHQRIPPSWSHSLRSGERSRNRRRLARSLKHALSPPSRRADSPIKQGRSHCRCRNFRSRTRLQGGDRSSANPGVVRIGTALSN